MVLSYHQKNGISRPLGGQLGDNFTFSGLFAVFVGKERQIHSLNRQLQMKIPKVWEIVTQNMYKFISVKAVC
jgi:hypothetical protein